MLLRKLSIVGILGMSLASPFCVLGNVRLADIEQDLRLLQQELVSCTAQIEELKRENASMARKLQQLQKDQDIQEANLLQAVDHSMEQWTRSLAQSAGQQRQVAEEPIKTAFSENYPKQGTPYTVAPGDTLSGIAKKMHTKVGYIQDANKIANPKGLQVGQTLFIPQGN